MSKGAKQALFIALAAVVIVAVMYTINNTGKGAGTVPLSQQGAQAQQDQVDPATLQRIQSLESTVKTNPKDVDALTELGYLYMDTGEIDKASATFSAALLVEPNNPQLHNFLGLSYFWTGRSNEAIAEYKKATALDPKVPEPYFNLALALSHSQPSDIPGAIENWKKVIELAPDSPIAKKSQEYIDKNQTGTRQTTTAPPVIKP